MNVDTPRCQRCEGTRFFHVRRMRDARYANDQVAWMSRPVGLGRVPNDYGQTECLAPVGHFETLACRSCGYTRWYAFDWSELRAHRTSASCVECSSIFCTTPCLCSN